MQTVRHIPANPLTVPSERPRGRSRQEPPAPRTEPLRSVPLAMGSLVVRILLRRRPGSWRLAPGVYGNRSSVLEGRKATSGPQIR